MNNSIRRLFFGLLGAAVGLLLFVIPSAQAQDGDGDKPDNSYCALCHSVEGAQVTLGDGTVLDLHVTSETLADSVHASVGCVDCHGETVFPHDGPTPADARSLRISIVENSCQTCHDVPPDTRHLEAIAAGNQNAAVCADCHGSHNVQPTEEQPELVSSACGNCHTDIFTDWSASPHVRLADAGCSLCHQSHGQQLVQEDPTELCTSCHRNVEGFVHDTHLASEFAVSCTSCHMLFDPNITLVSDEAGGTDHHMAAQVVACNTCHEQLIESGQWKQLVADPELVAERDDLRQDVTDLEKELERAHDTAAAEQEANQEGTGFSYVEILLALVVGLAAGGVAVLILLQRDKAVNLEQ